MKNWGVSVGTDDVHLYCEEMPWYAYFLSEYLQPLCCVALLRWKKKEFTFHDIPLPRWPTWIDEDGHRTHCAEQFGDIGCVMHLYLIDPVWQWAWRKQTRNFSVPVPWETLKPHMEASTIKWVEEHIAQQKTWAEEERLSGDTANTGTDNQNTRDNPGQSQVGA